MGLKERKHRVKKHKKLNSKYRKDIAVLGEMLVDYYREKFFLTEDPGFTKPYVKYTPNKAEALRIEVIKALKVAIKKIEEIDNQV